MASSSPFTHFTNQVATNTGAVNDFMQPSSSFTVQIETTGAVTAGAATILGSVDNVTFTPLSGAILTGKNPTGPGAPSLANGVVSFTQASSILVSSANAGSPVRFLRVDVTTAVVGGSLTASSLGH